MDWSADDILTGFEIQWREELTTLWNILETDSSIHENRGRRALINSWNTTADIRGFPPSERRIYLRVIGTTDSGRRSEPSGELTMLVSWKPPTTLGHQHDHTVGYRLSTLGVGGIDTAVRRASEKAFTGWRIHTAVDFCEAPCSANSDTHVISIYVRNVPSLSGRNVACTGSTACMKSVRESWDIDHHIGNHDIVIEQPPDYGAGTDKDPYKRYRWTRDPNKTGPTNLDRNFPNEEWRYLDATVLHEWGHPIGMRNKGDDPDYRGVMAYSQTYRNIMPADIAAVSEIYRSHTSGVGW